jgi:hypothetical protein
MIMNQLPLANSLTHLVLKDKLTICNGDVLKIASLIPFILFNNVFHVQDDLLIVCQPPNPTHKHESWDSKKWATT